MEQHSKLKPIELNKIAICHWIDTVATDNNWRTLEDALDWIDNERSVVVQVGFLLEDDENGITLTDSYLGDCVGGVTRIPRGSIKTIKIYDNFDNQVPERGEASSETK